MRGWKSMAIHEECGVFGIYDPAGDCARTTYYGLYALQHRGQEACGIAAMNGLEMRCHKDVGLVGDVFSAPVLDELGGTMAVGHVRYSTTGGSKRENAQPLTLSYVKGTFAVAHNGNLVNVDNLRRHYEYRGAIFHTTTDSEIIAYIIAQERLLCGSIERAVANAIHQLRGAFSLVVMSSRKLIAARDPWGFRPLCIGKRGDAWIFASESCALDCVGATFIRDVEPGEVVYVDLNGELQSIRDCCGTEKTSLCIFEYLYFARPDSIIDGQSVHDARILAGRCLAKEHPVEADVVIGVPDSGLNAAKGYAMESGIPYNDGLIKNRYIGRTFIQPGQANREQAVKLKLNPLRSTIAGKRVVVIDDSIVQPAGAPAAGRRGEGGPHAVIRAHVHRPLLFRHGHPLQKGTDGLQSYAGRDAGAYRRGQSGLSVSGQPAEDRAGVPLRLLRWLLYRALPPSGGGSGAELSIVKEPGRSPALFLPASDLTKITKTAYRAMRNAKNEIKICICAKMC